MIEKFSKKGLILTISLILFILVRLIFIFYSPYLFHEEKIKEGAIAADLLTKGLQLPFWGYLDSPHAGGSILASLSALPFIAILGNNYLAVKIAALFFSTLIGLVFVFKVKNKSKYNFFFPFLIYFIISVPNYFEKSLFLIGNINEPILFMILAFLLTEKVFLYRRKALINYFLLGLVLGLALWAQYLSVIALIVVLIVWHRNDNRFFLKKPFLIFFISLIIGILPFIIYNLSYGFPSFTSDLFMMKYPVKLNLGHISMRLFNLLILGLPQSFHFLEVGVFSSKLISYTFYLFSLLLIISAVLKNEIRFKGVDFDSLVFKFLLVGLLLVSVSSYPLVINDEWGKMSLYNHYYLVFLHPFIFYLSFVSLANHIRGKNYFVVFFSIFIGLLVIFNYVKIVDFSKKNKAIYSPAYRTSVFAYEAGINYGLNSKILLNFLEKLNPKFRQIYFSGAGSAWNYIINTEEIGDKKRGNLSEILKKMNRSEKKVFFSTVLKGEPWYKRGVSNYVFNKFLSEVSEANKIILWEIIHEEEQENKCTTN